MLNKIKTLFNKDGYNYSEGLVDPLDFHKTFYKLLVAFKVAEVDNKYSKIWLIHNAVITIMGLTTAILTLISLCHGLDTFDIPFMTEAGSYFIVTFYQVFIMSCTKVNLPQYHNLLKAMKDDFQYICTVGAKYREKYFENQVQTWKICIFVCVFMGFIPIGNITFTTLSLIYFLVTRKSEDEGSRPLLFPFWLPNIDFGKTPYYEIAFVFSDACVVLYCYTHAFMMQTQIVWIRHIISKADIIVWNIQDLLDDINLNNNGCHRASKLIVARMRNIVIHHQSMLSVLDDYTTVYKKLLMYEQKCCWPLICLSAYSTAEKLDEGEFQAILVLLCVGTIVVFFIPCYMCTLLANKVSTIGDACWNIPFWKTGPAIRLYMMLLMQRARRPLPLQAPGFESISLETFSKKISSAYSFFNMLRQISLK